MIRFAVAIILMSWAMPALAGTNLPALAEYPAPDCIKPAGGLQAPAPPTVSVVSGSGMTIKTVSGGKSVGDYNKTVAQNNAAESKYTDCINAYVTGAQADMDAIRELVNRSLAAKTNFPPLKDYPAPDCRKPGEIPEVAGQTDNLAATNQAVKQYNRQIAQYNADLHQYTACMNAYVANAEADIGLIRERANQAVSGAKSR